MDMPRHHYHPKPPCLFLPLPLQGGIYTVELLQYVYGLYQTRRVSRARNQQKIISSEISSSEISSSEISNSSSAGSMETMN